jgi:hypothetical protein
MTAAQKMAMKNGSVKVVTYGINMQCRKVMTTCEIVYQNKQFLIKTSGFLMVVRDFSDYYIDTPENRAKVKAYIKNNQ